MSTERDAPVSWWLQVDHIHQSGGFTALAMSQQARMRKANWTTLAIPTLHQESERKKQRAAAASAWEEA